MKDHPHLRGAAESYNSLKEAFLPLLHLSRMMGAIAARASLHFLFSLVAHHTHSPPQDKDYIDLSLYQ